MADKIDRRSRNRRGLLLPDEDQTERSLPFREQPHTEEELIEYDHGLEAGLAGRPNDYKKSSAWRRGWADSQE
jgi:hypothetical protein